MAEEKESALKQIGMLAPLPLTERGYGLHLGGTLKKKNRFLYCNASLVIQRELDDLSQATINTLHSVKANVAKYSPNGEWVCSGDDGGNTMVWAHQSHVVKNTIAVGRKVLDIAWSADGQRIFACGAGKDDKAKVFPWNTNNKLGDISGSSKGFLSCDFKPNRPFRVIAGSEDYAVYFYKGPPFKFESYAKSHSNYVNSVRYSSDGAFYMSAGSDKKIFVFDGKTGEKIREIVDKKGGHKGTIYEIAWGPENKRFMTASADKTVKIWDFESGKVLETFTFTRDGEKPTVNHMQVGCLWMGDYMLSVSLSGRINFLASGKEKPVRVVTGHKKSIADMVVNAQDGLVYTADLNGYIVRTDSKTYNAVDMVGDPHKGKAISAISLNADSSALWSIGVDDTVFFHDDIVSGNLSAKGVKADGACRGAVAANQDKSKFFLVTHRQTLLVFDGANIAKQSKIACDPRCIAISPDDSEIAIGAADNTVHFYDGTSLKETRVLKNAFLKGELTRVSYSPDGKYLSTADKYRHVWVWDRAGDFSEPVNRVKSFMFHNAVPLDCQWATDSKKMATVGHDSNLYVWTKPLEDNSFERVEGACTGSIKRVAWLSENTLVLCSTDCTVRFFQIDC